MQITKTERRLRRRVRRVERYAAFVGGSILTCGFVAVIWALKEVF